MRLRSALALLAVLTAEPTARADGVVAYGKAAGWALAVERAQDVVVAWRDGRQRLLLKTIVERPAASASALVWVLPVPAPATRVKVDVLRDWPVIEGVDVPAASVQRAQSILLWSTSTQLWPLVFAPMLPRHAIPIVQQPLVPARLLHDGIRIDTLSAPSAAALAEALARIDVFLASTAFDGFDSYFGDGGSFVVYRMAALPVAAVSDEPFDALAVAVEFPSPQNSVVPLKLGAPRSVPMEVRLTVRGYVRAAGDVPVATTHYIGSILDPTVATETGTTQSDQRFTELRIVASARWSGHALRLQPEKSTRMAWAADWLVRSRGPVASVVLSLLYLAIVAPLAALAVRRLWPRNARPSRRMMLALGISHLATVLGAIATALLLARRLGAPRRAALLTVAAHSVLIVTITLMLAAITRRAFQ